MLLRRFVTRKTPRKRWLATSAACAVAAVGVGAVPVVSASAAAKPKPKPKPTIVKVADDYFSPATLTVGKGQTVKWVWDSMNTNTHNVTLTKAPKSVKKGQFKSADGSIGIRFERQLTTPGSYTFICTVHPTVMRTTITVTK